MKKNIAVYAIFLFFFPGVGWAFSKYNEKSKELSSQIYRVLIDAGICSDSQDCREKEIFYGDHGDRLVFNFYSVQDSQAIKNLVNVSLAFSFQEKVSVTVVFYPEAHRDLLGGRRFFSNPVVKVETNL